jgi:chaperonin GroEL
MTAKQIEYNHQAHQSILRGVSTLAHAVRTTFGPSGRCVIIRKEFGPPLVINDGAKVAAELDLEDHFENLGLKIARQAASKTNEIAGDGTTTATILAEAFYREGLRSIEGGINRMLLKRGMDLAVADLVENLRKLSAPVKSDDDVRRVATVSANFDLEIGEKVAHARELVGKEGVILIEEGHSLQTEVEVVKGMQFDRGYLSPYFITDAEHMTADLEDPFILIHEKKLSTMRELLPLLEKVVQSGKPLLVIAEDVESEVLATLVINRLRGLLTCCAVKAPGYGDRRKALLQDIAILTGAEAVFADLGMRLENLELRQLGRAKRVEVAKDATTIIEGAGNPQDVEARVKQLRHELESVKSDYDREKLEERIGKLTGGIAKIIVGAGTEIEMKEKLSRVEDAVLATRAALEEGIVPGGGVAILRAASACGRPELSHDEQAGYQAVLRGCRAPLYWIAENAGKAGGVILSHVEELSGSIGYDVLSDNYVDMLEAGIIDPTKVVITALTSAGSVATLLLTSDTLIAEAGDQDGRSR